jgi:hypothetical protein
VSAAGIKYNSVGAAFNRHTRQLENTKEWKPEFYQHIGASLDSLTFHPLEGEGFYRQWINIHGKAKQLYGSITKVENDNVEDELKFTVTYDKNSRKMANASDSGCGGNLVPSCETIDQRIALGGCLSFLIKTGSNERSLIDQAPFHTRWIAPDDYHRELVHQRSGRDGTDVDSFPQVVIHHGLFELRFNVKTSTIQNAGCGVFLSCRPLLGKPDLAAYFELKPGELLDFGIYAPYRTQDKKSDYLHLILNFIHNFKTEEYSFDTPEGDQSFDITDEVTGELHMEARKHVPPFVNEITGSNIPEVHAMHDCQGNLHYLLGHDEQRHGPFRIKADGKEQEIFIDYGARYENVRLRKGFARKQVDETEALARLKDDERDYIDEVATYSANEVKDSVKFLEKIASVERGLKQSVIERIVVVTILLKHRAENILREFANLTEEDSICDNGATDLDEKIVESCDKLLRRVCRLWGNDPDFQKRMLEVDIFARACEGVFPGRNLGSLSPSAFRNLICGS